MSAALIEIRDVDGKLSCSVHWCDDNADSAKYDHNSGAHKAGAKIIAFMDEAFGRLGDAEIKTAADVEAALTERMANAHDHDAPQDAVVVRPAQ